MMSQYQVLARKYRPKNFAQLLGQTHVSAALANAIDTNRLHHAYLFTGTRGVGKTTIARILAKCLNCDTGITSKPCGVCDSCVSIDEGRFIDLIEIDAASRTKVEDTRDLLENVPYAPTQGRYKVYLIDEVHMLSTHSFNALLKTLEEPPAHVKFILATTDPQKLPITIISRCLQFVLRPLSQSLLHEHLQKILTAENIAFSDGALWQLAQSAKGSVRDALSLTDQAIAFGGGALQDDTVANMLGLVDSLDVLALIGDIFADRRTQVAAHIARLRTQMVDASAIFDRLVDSLHQMALVQVLPDVPLDMNDAQKQAFYELAASIPADVLQLYYDIAIRARDGVRLATTPMQALEMGILRLLAFRPLAVGVAPADKIANAAPNPSNPPNDTPADNLAADTSLQIAPAENSINSDGVDLANADELLSDELHLNDLPANHLPTDDLQADDLPTDYAQTDNPPANQPLADNSQLDNLPPSDESDELENTDNLTHANLTHTPADNNANLADDTAGQTLQTEHNELKHSPSDDALYSHTAHAVDKLSVNDENLPVVSDDLSKVNADDEALLGETQSDKALPNGDFNTANLSSSEPTIDGEFNHASTSAPSNELNSEPANERINEPTYTQTQDEQTHNLPTVYSKAQMRERLKAPPAELSGDWTQDKWDYWLSGARQAGVLSNDELALLSASQMVGEIEGDSTLYVGEHNAQVHASFATFKQKITEQFTNMRLSDDLPLLQNVDDTPKQRQLARRAQVMMDVQSQLTNSPVAMSLWQQGFIVDDGQPILAGAKLLLD
ncbi:DNA polymerase III subunit gamma/tau [Moraxella caviae]|uniref:DNA polymerase III subunit gamma/tau n=1 Tax=Moraxella caviae TaxID=34060 RepID=UPI0035302914